MPQGVAKKKKKFIHPWTHYLHGLYKYCLIHITSHIQVET